MSETPVTAEMVQRAFQLGLIAGFLLALFVSWFADILSNIIYRRAKKWVERRQAEREVEWQRCLKVGKERAEKIKWE